MQFVNSGYQNLFLGGFSAIIKFPKIRTKKGFGNRFGFHIKKNGMV